MSNIAKWIIGFIFAVISMNENVNTDDESRPNCHIFSIGENKGVNCSNRGLKRIPRPEILHIHNSAEIKILDISNNVKMLLYDDDFVSTYTHLAVLLMRWLVSAKNFSYKFFEPLHTVEHLDLTGMNLRDDSGAIGQILPKHLLICVVEHCRITKFDISELKFLSSLHIAYNNLNNIPTISKETPLIQLDIRMNPLNNFQYIDIVPFCLLTRLFLQHPENSELNSSAKYSECCQLERWIKDSNIDGTVSLNCTPLHGESSECIYQNTSASLLAFAERNACLIRNEIIQDDGFWFYFTNTCIAIILIIAMTFLVYRYYYKRRAKRGRRATAYNINTDDAED